MIHVASIVKFKHRTLHLVLVYRVKGSIQPTLRKFFFFSQNHFFVLITESAFNFNKFYWRIFWLLSSVSYWCVSALFQVCVCVLLVSAAETQMCPCRPTVSQTHLCSLSFSSNSPLQSVLVAVLKYLVIGYISIWESNPLPNIFRFIHITLSPSAFYFETGLHLYVLLFTCEVWTVVLCLIVVSSSPQTNMIKCQQTNMIKSPQTNMIKCHLLLIRNPHWIKTQRSLIKNIKRGI